MTPEGRDFSLAELQPLTRALATLSPLKRGRGAGGEGDLCVRQGSRSRTSGQVKPCPSEGFILTLSYVRKNYLGSGRKAASSFSGGRVFNTFFFSIQPRRAVITP